MGGAGPLDPDRPVGIGEHFDDIIGVERRRDGAAKGRAQHGLAAA